MATLLVVRTSTSESSDYLADEFKKERRIDLRKDPNGVAAAQGRLRETGKDGISSATQTDVNLPFTNGIRMGEEISRSK